MNAKRPVAKTVAVAMTDEERLRQLAEGLPQTPARARLVMNDADLWLGSLIDALAKNVSKVGLDALVYRSDIATVINDQSDQIDRLVARVTDLETLVGQLTDAGPWQRSTGYPPPIDPSDLVRGPSGPTEPDPGTVGGGPGGPDV